ncbi:RING finger protein 32 [Polypterus senegalus]|uniref:RING finger protein 32 n=1 Tax=Polypterus senegalus TaxID=55291 RepID=UPI001962BBB0|nr:RING finger protein 32 [Polypterus senegalus]XP_039609555.1 RING finger protein 32 [Polypterus senegalus]
MMSLGSGDLKSKAGLNGKSATKFSNTSMDTLAMTAVALQDHISRSVQLSFTDPSKRNLRNTRDKKNFRDCQVKPRVDSGLKIKTVTKNRDDTQEEEYVLDPNPPRLTLAQRMGLVEAPAMPLTADEWYKVKERSIREGDLSQPCAICKEDLGLQQQVLLSCSHVFHRVCLQAFERFSQKKSCPMCRMEQYQSRIIHDGTFLYKIKCATRIQAYWRGYVIRKWYRHIRKTIPPKDKNLRRKFFEEKLHELNQNFLRMCDSNVDNFISEIDNSVALSRSIIQQYEDKYRFKISEEQWDEIQKKAVLRETLDCPICITPLSCFGSLTSPPSANKGTEIRQIVLLSCTHVFHHKCLQAFEDFSEEQVPVCPLCRSSYQKKVF